MILFRPVILLVVLAIATLSTAAQAQMVLSSPSIEKDGLLPMAQVFNNFGCVGENASPALDWSHVPSEAKSLALTVYDPDAPTGSGWWHWNVFNLPVSLNALPANASTTEGALPQGAIQNINDYGFVGFGGACPPEGDAPHRYIFTLHALDTESLPLDEHASSAMIGYYLHVHGLETASFTATYGR